MELVISAETPSLANLAIEHVALVWLKTWPLFIPAYIHSRALTTTVYGRQVHDRLTAKSFRV